MKVRTGNHNPTCGFKDDMREHQNIEKRDKAGKCHFERRLGTLFGLNPLLAADSTRLVRRLTCRSASAASGWENSRE